MVWTLHVRMERQVISKLVNGRKEHIAPVVDIGVCAGIGYSYSTWQ